MKYLKAGRYYVNIVDQIFRSFETQEDYGHLVNDFAKFANMGCDLQGDTVELIINQTPEDIKATFVRYPITSVDNYLDFFDVFEPCNAEAWNPSTNCSDQKELSPEERIKQLEKEKAELELIVKQGQKYEEFKKSTDEIALFRKAMMDSGFTREEAMNMMMVGLMGTMIPDPFKRR